MRRLAEVKENIPQNDLSDSDTTTSEYLPSSTVRGIPSRSISANREAYSRFPPPGDGRTRKNPQIIQPNYPDVCPPDITSTTTDIQRTTTSGCTPPITDDNHKRTASIGYPVGFRAKTVLSPETHQSQGNEPRHTTTSRGHNDDVTIIDECHSNTDHTASSMGNHGKHQPQQPKDRHMFGSEIREKRPHGRQYTATKTSPTINREESFTDRDARLIPDRGKKPTRR
jgi:hypothetical protein